MAQGRSSWSLLRNGRRDHGAIVPKQWGRGRTENFQPWSRLGSEVSWCLPPDYDSEFLAPAPPQFWRWSILNSQQTIARHCTILQGLSRLFQHVVSAHCSTGSLERARAPLCKTQKQAKVLHLKSSCHPDHACISGDNIFNQPLHFQTTWGPQFRACDVPICSATSARRSQFEPRNSNHRQVFCIWLALLFCIS